MCLGKPDYTLIRNKYIKIPVVFSSFLIRNMYVLIKYFGFLMKCLILLAIVAIMIPEMTFTWRIMEIVKTAKRTAKNSLFIKRLHWLSLFLTRY